MSDLSKKQTDTDHRLVVAKVRERLAVSNRETKKFDIERFNLKKLSVLEGMELGCHELRSKRYISDGLCTTPKPINEVVCADWCIMPPGQMPGQQSPTFMSKIDWREWATRQKQKKTSSVMPSPFLMGNDTIATLMPQKWRCVDGTAKKRRVTLICKDGSRRIYRVKVVKRCKCTKKHMKQQDKRKKTRRLDQSKKRIA
ncbi:hypothetical protein B7P43_G01138 [Cryptotermes secundus]|uniref:Sclerostin domain-containing protein 1 n=1 Tax=Cryptotermes secundus TaxID=105785 RepID=A0A2J7QZV2_9NEOP|nr:hypothetical protein B7P43_G01138 [Cryptotermes secundus]